MYPKPEEKSGALALFQYVGAVAPSANSVPPTAMLYGVDAAPFTAKPFGRDSGGCVVATRCPIVAGCD